MLMALTKHSKKNMEQVIQKLERSNYAGPTQKERQEQKFELYIEKSKPDDYKVVKLSGLDMYLRTAESVLYTLPYLIKSDKTGIFSPFEIIGDMSVFDNMCKESEMRVEYFDK